VKYPNAEYPARAKKTVHVVLHQPEKTEGLWKSSLRHPLVLALAGTLFASGILQYWQSVVAARERDTAASQQQLERRFALVREIVGAFSETLAANEDVLYIYERELDGTRDKQEIKERWQAWRQASAKWRATSEALFTRLAFEYSKEDAAEYEHLAERRGGITNKVSNLSPGDLATVSVCIDSINALKTDIRRFTQKLATKANSLAKPSPGLLARLLAKGPQGVPGTAMPTPQP
jgi:hypothetical protein